jgi:hypothetical protein
VAVIAKRLRVQLGVGAVVAIVLWGWPVTPSATAAATIEFAPAVDYPTGSMVGPGPGAVTTIAGDANGDGAVDVMVTDPLGAGPLVLLNDGDGTFGAPGLVAAESGVGALAAGDVDGDHDLDLVGRTGDEVLVMLGSGDGTFATTSRLTASGNAQQAVAVLDANADHRPDIAATTPSGVQTFLGGGDGTFTPGPTTPLLGLLSDLTPATFDGDGRADLAVVDATPLSQRIVALRGNGDGSFVESGSGAVGRGPEGVMAGDLDGDGFDDAVSVDSFSGPAFSISVLLSDGAGGFGPATHLPTAWGPVSGAIGDLDGDDDLDVVVSGVGAAAVTIYAGDGAGALAVVGQPSVTPFPQTPVIADLDGDTRPDIAVPGPGQLSVLRNVGAGGGPPPAPDNGSPTESPFADELPATGGSSPAPVALVLIAVACVVRSVRRDEL